MSRHRISRRRFVQGSATTAALAGTVAFYGPWQHNRAYAQAKPIKLGLTCDASGQYGNSGQDDLRGIRMAIAEFNAKGGVLGRKVECGHGRYRDDAGHRQPRRRALHHARGLHGADRRACTRASPTPSPRWRQSTASIYLNTNSSAPSEAGENCSRVKFVWDGNGTNFSKAAVRNAVTSIGKNWLLLTNDYVWGHTTSAATKTQVEAAGGKIIDNLLVPQNTRDFTSYLLKVQQAQARRGGDRDRRRRHQGAAPAGRRSSSSTSKPAWINNQQDWPDVWGAPESLFGVFGTTWYHKLRCRASPTSSRSGRPPTRTGPSQCRATSPTTATWRRASCCAPWSAPAPPTTSRSSGSWRTSEFQQPSACSISTPT